MIVLKPKVILRHVQEGEEILWMKSDLTVVDGAQNDPATTLVRRGHLVRQIHQYFGGLEPRKCCLALSGCKTSFSNVRLVRNDGRDSGIEEGAMIRSPADTTETIKDLTVQEERVFRRSYVCASYPVLCAPEPPSPLSPPPVVPQGSKKFQFKGQLTITRPPTPDDSGLEEDMSVVPADTLFELLRRTFHLSQENFNKYEHQIYRFHQRKEPSRILAEELVGQLALLENNVNPYYNPESFMSSSGYDSWQRREFSHIAELLKKFWHTAYPPLANNYKQTQRGILEDYKTLLLKLLRYESPYRVEGELLAPGLSCLLSSASVRLLKEFGLRYGIREVYRKLVYLQYLTGNFVPSSWFIQHTCNTLLSVLDMLPNSGASHVLLKVEYDILKESIEALEKLGNSNICKMKSLFPNNRPSDGLDSLIYLVTLTQRGRQYLLDKKSHSVVAILKDCVQSIFPVCYEEYKIVAMKDLHQKDTGLSPTLVNKMICKIRDEVKDYKAYYQATFEKYFNVTLMAAQKLYILLMEDVAKLCQNQPRNANIDRCMLGLAYRLNQLDQAWVAYISEEQQTWRTWFEAEQGHWTKVLNVRMMKLIRETVSKDKFEGAVVQDIHSIIDTPSSSLVGHRIRSLSNKSITPSINSAFSGMMSSLHSTPLYSRFTPLHRQDSKRSSENTPVNQIKDPSGNPDSWFSKLHISVSAPGPFRDTQSLCDFSEEEEEGVMTFSNLRHSSSVPEMLSKSYDHHLDVMRPSPKFPVLKSHETGVNSVQELRENSPFQTPPENKPPAKQANSGMNNFSNCPGSKDDDEVNTIDESDYSHETNKKSNTDFKQEGTDGSQHEGEITDLEGEVTPSQTDSHQQLLNQNAMKVGQIPHGDRIDGDQDSLAGEFTQSLEEEDKEGDHESLSSTQDSPIPNFNFPPVSEVVTLDSEKLTEDDQSDQPVTSISNSKEQQQYGASSSANDSKEPLSSSEVENSSPECQTSSSDIPASIRSVKSAYIPVSGSLFDVLVLLQRIIGFGKTLCQTFYKSTSSHRMTELESSFSSSTTVSSYFGGDMRKKLYTQFHEVVCNTLTVYADNILCLDLCGTTHSEGTRLVGAKMVEHLQNCKQSNKIWGCRHQTLGMTDCFQYVNRQTDMLCDRYEPVSQAMCIRMNIVSSLLSYCEVFYKKLASVFNYEWSQVSPTEFYGLSEDGGLNSMDACKSHFQTVRRSLARLMAYRLNLFVYDAMMIYLALRDTRRSMAANLIPLTQFLGSYIDLLNQWLYLDNFHIVMENLWVFIVQNFEKETVNLVHNENSLEAGEQLVQAFTILLKLMSSKDAGIHRNLLLSQAESVMFKLQIYTTASNQLIQLYEKLTEHYYGSDTVSICTLDGTVKTILHRIREDLLIYRKCFSGSHLVSWIMHHPELFYQFEPDLENSDNSKEKRWTAISIAESLLKGRIIVDLDAEDDTDSEEDNVVDFPEISLAGENGSSFVYDGNISSTFTPRATPVPHTEERPQSSLKRSLHQNLHSHQRATPVLQRSQRSYECHPSHVTHQTSRCSNPATPNIEQSHHTDTVRSTIQQSLRTYVSPSPMKLNPQSLKAQKSFHLSQTHQDEQSNLRAKDEVSSYRQREPASEVGDNNVRDEMPRATAVAKDNPVFRTVSHSELDYHDIGGWHLPHRTTPNLNESLLNNSFQDSEFLFEDSRRKYYRVASFADSLTPNRASGSEELNSLIEKCIELKIIPDFVFRILLSRKYFDDTARLYVEKRARGEKDLFCEVS